MTNVVRFHGAMHPRHHVCVDGLSEADLDAQIAAGRERFYDSLDPFVEFDRRKEARNARRRPLVHQLDNSLRARLIRWLRNLSLRGPRL